MAHQGTVRDLNQQAVLQVLRREQAMSRAQLARALDLTKATISAVVAGLIEQGLLIEGGMTVVGDRGGRPGAVVALNPRGATFLGAEFSESHLTLAAIRLDGTEAARTSVTLRRRLRLDTILDRLCAMIDQFTRERADDLPNLAGVGVAVPGTVHPDGQVTWISGLSWPSVDVADRIQRAVDLPVVVENDANAAAMAELLLAPDGVADDFLYLLLNYGVGSAIVANGQLYRGADGWSGEVGHMRVDSDGPVCPHCGGTGCFETFVNTDAVLRYHAEAGGADKRWDEVLSDVSDHPEDAQRRWVWWLARGIISIGYILNPRQLVLGGSMASVAAALLPALTTEIERQSTGIAGSLQTRLSSFGAAQGAIGAAALLYQQTFSPSRPVPRALAGSPTAQATSS